MMAKRGFNRIYHSHWSNIKEQQLLFPSFFTVEAKCLPTLVGISSRCSTTALTLHHAHTTPQHKRPLSHSGWRRGSFYGGLNTTEALCGLWGSLFAGLDWSPEPVATAAPGLSWQNRIEHTGPTAHQIHEHKPNKVASITPSYMGVLYTPNTSASETSFWRNLYGWI